MTLAAAGFHISGPVAVLGVLTGMEYGLLAVGLLLVYRSSRIINFAHGDIGALGAAVVVLAVRKWGLPYWVAFGVAVAVAAAVGAAAEVVVVRRLKAAPLVVTVIATLGLGQILTLVAAILDNGIGAGTAFPQPAGMPQFSIGALLVNRAYTASLALSPMVVVALAWFLRRGRLGLAMRAAASNSDTARVSGVPSGRLSAMAWALAGAVAAFTAILVLPTRGFSAGAFLGPGLLLRALVCCVLARMASLPVAFVAGIGLGVLEQLLLANYSSGSQVEMMIFVIIVIVLLVQRPQHGRGQEKNAWATVQAFAPLPMSYRRVPAIRNLGWVLAGVGFFLGLLVPELLSNAQAAIFTLIAAFAIMGLSVTLLAGLGGQLSLGQVAIGGVGAVCSYIGARHGVPFVFCLVIAAIASAFVSLLLALPAVRIRGLMLAVATLAFALAGQDWLFEQQWMLGHGVTSQRPAIGGFRFVGGHHYYYVAFATLALAMVLARNIWQSGVGRRLRAVRDNEDAARAFTVPATTVRVQIFVLGGVLAGLGGAVYGTFLSLQTSNAYAVQFSIAVAALAVVGGIGLLAGPILGGLYIIGLPHWLPLDNVGLAATSAGWLMLLLRFPGGVGQSLAPLRDRIVDALARRAGLDPRTERSATPAGGLSGASEGMRLPAAPARATPTGECLLRGDGLTKHFGGVTAVDGVNIEVLSGETLGLIGPNGAGKSTLFELLGGFTRPDAGSIFFQGRDVTRERPETRARQGLIRSFQDAALFPTMTVLEAVMVALERTEPTRFVAAALGLDRAGDRRKAAQAEDLLSALGLMSFADTQINALSTGTRRITDLVCLIALEPVLLLLDEPTAGIAQRESEALGEVLAVIKAELDLTMVIIEHDNPLVMGISDRVVAMEAGKVISVGTPTEVQSDARVIASYLGGDLRTIQRSGKTRRTSGARSRKVPAGR